MREFDRGLLLISRDLRVDEASKDSLRDTTTAAGARPSCFFDSAKWCGNECESTVCEAFTSSLSPSANSSENDLCLSNCKDQRIFKSSMNFES